MNIKKGCGFLQSHPFFFKERSNINYCASFICRNNSFCFSFKPVGNFTL